MNCGTVHSKRFRMQNWLIPGNDQLWPGQVPSLSFLTYNIKLSISTSQDFIPKYIRDKLCINMYTWHRKITLVFETFQILIIASTYSLVIWSYECSILHMRKINFNRLRILSKVTQIINRMARFQLGLRSPLVHLSSTLPAFQCHDWPQSQK